MSGRAMTSWVELGRYRVLRPLGRGGMAEVSEAVAVGAEGFERRVAIKQLLPEHAMEPGLLGMFLDEARIASRLHHANIVSVLDYGVIDGRPFQVLELVDGKDAEFLYAEGIRRAHPFPLALVLHVGTIIAHALHHAHTACDAEGQRLGIVHRDVSPANILVSWNGDVLLADFGIAVAKHRRERTRTGVAKGTVRYWSPEQATGGQVDARADVFSLAATVHRLLVGHSPLAGENALADLLVGRPLPLDPSLPDDVAHVLTRALQRDKARRYDDADELAAALGACMSRRLREDPRSALKRWLGSLRTPSPSPVPVVGALDALLGLEWVVVGEQQGVRTFVSHETPAPVSRVDAPAVAPSPGVVSDTEIGPGPPSLVPPKTVVVEPTSSRVAGRSVVLPLIAIVMGIATVGIVAGIRWSWWGPEDLSPSGPLRAVDGSLGLAFDRSVTDGETAAGRVVDDPTTVGAAKERMLDGVTTDGTTEGSAARPTEGSAARLTVEPEPETSSTTQSPPTSGHAPAKGRSAGRSPARPRASESPDRDGTGFLLIGGGGALRAEIFVDGRRRGHAPRRIELSTGRHEIVLRDEHGRAIASRELELHTAHTRSAPFRWVIPDKRTAPRP